MSYRTQVTLYNSKGEPVEGGLVWVSNASSLGTKKTNKKGECEFVFGSNKTEYTVCAKKNGEKISRTVKGGKPISLQFGEKKGGCFITTAVCDHMGKGDNCSELQALRLFRDDVLLRDDMWRRLVEEYYQRAPQLLTLLEKRSDRAEILDDLYHRFITELVMHSSTRSEHVMRIKRYKDMVEWLELRLISCPDSSTYRASCG